MAAGVPVAVSQAGSLPEVCGRAALYFDPLKIEDMANCMVELASNSPLRESLIAAEAEQCRRFNWESCAGHTAQALRACLDAGQGPGVRTAPIQHRS
jgi:glycosyltransferase involved in cell wall biosynthesis